MADLSSISSLKEDPLNAYSGLSLFPRTLKSLSIHLPPCTNQSDDLLRMHTLLESMPFDIQKEHQEQAKAILDDCSELIKQGIGTNVASDDMNVGVKNPIQNRGERRPGIDQRGHFSFKPILSQPPSNEPTFDGSKYPRPDDYSAAVERYKNAKRAWQRETGLTVADSNQNQPARRPSRPGISCYFDVANLETSEKENSIPSEQILEKPTPVHVSTAIREVDDSNVDMSEVLENILSELLSCNTDELKGDGAVKLLEERLQIKPIEVEKLNMNLKSSGRNPTHRKFALSNIQNMLKGIDSDAVQKVASMDPFTVEEDSIPYQQDESSKSRNRNLEQSNTVDGSFEQAEQIQEQNEEEFQKSSQELTDERRKESGDSNTKKRSKTASGESEGGSKQSQESGANKQTKRKPQEKKLMKKVTREAKTYSRRKSLEAAGTKFEFGVRRSTRIKSRPLEYWRGERFLFGRIHESLATVIGIKYASPQTGKIEKRALKVKSFVTDDYKELVDFAALH